MECQKHSFKDEKKSYCPKCLVQERGKSLEYSTLKSRIETLIENPRLIEQDQFGVCGMTSILHGLLLAKPKRFEDLCVAAFFGKKFMMAKNNGEVTIDLANLLKYFKGGTGDEKDNYFVDYIASRALGQIMKTKNKKLYTEQKKEFNVHFDESEIKNYKNYTKGGNLGLQTKALVWILEEVIGTSSCESFVGMNQKTFSAFVSKSATSKALNLAGICIDLIQPPPKDSGHTGPSKGPENKGADYDHWIVIEKIETKKQSYVITYWTWGRPKQSSITVPIEHAHTFIRDAVTAVILAN